MGAMQSIPVAVESTTKKNPHPHQSDSLLNNGLIWDGGVSCFAKGDSPTSMCPHTGLDHIARKHVEDVESMLKTRLVALGLWSDGVPVNWDRSESIQCVTWALFCPGTLWMVLETDDVRQVSSCDAQWRTFC